MTIFLHVLLNKLENSSGRHAEVTSSSETEISDTPEVKSGNFEVESEAKPEVKLHRVQSGIRYVARQSVKTSENEISSKENSKNLVLENRLLLQGLKIEKVEVQPENTFKAQLEKIIY